MTSADDALVAECLAGVPILPGPGVDPVRLRGWAARKLAYEDAAWAIDVNQSACTNVDVQWFIGLSVTHHFVRIAYEGATLLRASNPAAGIPLLADLLTDHYATITKRYRHSTKLLDDTGKPLETMLSEFDDELKSHREEFLGNSWKCVRWAESDLGMYLIDGAVVGATVPASYRLGVSVSTKAHKTGEGILAVAEEWGAILAAVRSATLLVDEPDSSLDLRGVEVQSRDRRAARYLRRRFEPSFPIALKMLLLLIEGDLNTSRLFLPLTAPGHEGPVFRAQFVTVYHSLTSLQRIADEYLAITSPGLTELRALLNSAPAMRLVSRGGLNIRNRCVHYEMNDPAILPDLTMPMCGLIEAVFPGQTWESVKSDVHLVTEQLAVVLGRWRR